MAGFIGLLLSLFAGGSAMTNLQDTSGSGASSDSTSNALAGGFLAGFVQLQVAFWLFLMLVGLAFVLAGYGFQYMEARRREGFRLH